MILIRRRRSLLAEELIFYACHRGKLLLKISTKHMDDVIKFLLELDPQQGVFREGIQIKSMIFLEGFYNETRSLKDNFIFCRVDLR